MSGTVTLDGIGGGVITTRNAWAICPAGTYGLFGGVGPRDANQVSQDVIGSAAPDTADRSRWMFTLWNYGASSREARYWLACVAP